jgi:hypothetical protein
VSDITFALGIPHAKHRPERVKSLARLMAALDVYEPTPETWALVPHLKVFDRKCPYWEWSGEMWHWQLEKGGTHALVLQDDVMPMPNFWGALKAMVTAVPDQVLALETVHPAAMHFARENIGRWLRSWDGLIGVQYVIPRNLLAEFLHWRTWNLKRDAVCYITEDALIDCWLIDTGRKAWHPVPALASHDVGIPSTNTGFDLHPFRNVAVKWSDGANCARDDGSPGWTVEQLATPEFWQVTKDPEDMGRFYGSTHSLALQWVTSFDDEKWAAVQAARPPMRFAKWMSGV